MQPVKYAVIAAAGMGVRLGLGRPKCLIEVEGKTLLAHLLLGLQDVKNIRLCVGFMADDVISEARKIRDDIVFVFNHAYQTTTTLTSYVLASNGIKSPVLYMDSDIYFDPDSFKDFLKKATMSEEALIGITSTKTQDCVYVHTDKDKKIVKFSRSEPSSFEWANLAYLPVGMLCDANEAVFEQLSRHTPLNTCKTFSFEVDTKKDYQILINHLKEKKGYHLHGF